jgi:gluconolactonase
MNRRRNPAVARAACAFLLAVSAALLEAATPPRAAEYVERLDPRLDALIPADAVVERVADGVEWAEGPLWDARDRSLLFSDVPRNGVFRWRAGQGVEQVIERSGRSADASRAPTA